MPESKSIKELVIERLASSGPDSKERLITSMVDSEMEKRHEILLKAVKLVELAEGQAAAAAKPDAMTFDGNGAITSSSYTQSGLKQMKSTKERLMKLQAAFNKALEQGDFKELTPLVNQQFGGEKKEGGKPPSSEEVRAGG